VTRSWYDIETLTNIRVTEAQQRAERYRRLHPKRSDDAVGTGITDVRPKPRPLSWLVSGMSRVRQHPTLLAKRQRREEV